MNSITSLSRNHYGLASIGMVFLVLSFSGCMLKETHEKQLAEQQDKHSRQLSAMESSYQNTIAAKDEELRRTKDEAQKAIGEARRESYGRAVRGLPLEERLEMPSPVITVLVWVSIALLISFLFVGLCYLVHDEASSLVWGKMVNIPVGAFIFWHLANHTVSDLSFRQSLVNTAAIEATLIVGGFLFALGFAWLLTNKQNLWLICAAVTATTTVLMQAIMYALNGKLIISVLGPVSALQILSAPLIGAALYLACRTCIGFRKDFLEKSKPSFARERPKYQTPPPSVVRDEKEQYA